MIFMKNKKSFKINDLKNIDISSQIRQFEFVAEGNTSA